MEFMPWMRGKEPSSDIAALCDAPWKMPYENGGMCDYGATVPVMPHQDKAVGKVYLVP